MFLRLLLIFTMLPLANLAAAEEKYDFSEADALFAQRSKETVSEAEQAIDLYRESLSQVSGDELLYAIAQISKLYIYIGDMTLPFDAKRQRLRIFDNCLSTLEQYIKPNKFGSPTPQYYYYKIYCLALWGKSANPLHLANTHACDETRDERRDET